MRHSEIVLLGLLREGRRYGYEIDQAIDSRDIRQWARIGTSTVYATLERLRKQGHVNVVTETVGSRPPRRVFSLSAKGRAQHKKLVEEALASPDPAHSDRIVGLVFGHAMGSHSARRMLYGALAENERRSDEIKQIRPAPSDEIGRIVSDYLTAVTRAERKALQRTTELLVR